MISINLEEKKTVKNQVPSLYLNSPTRFHASMSVVEMEELGFQQLEAEGFDIDEDLQPVYIPTSAPTDVHQVHGRNRLYS